MDDFNPTNILVVGVAGGTHMGASFLRAAPALGLSLCLVDSAMAFEGPSILRRLMWSVARRPVNLAAFSRLCVDRAIQSGAKVVITTGNAPLTCKALQGLGEWGIFRVNVSTDDPWNPAHRAPWFLQALPAYDLVLTPRHANMADFHGLGCADVRYLPFGYDDTLFMRQTPVPDGETASQVLFVGGADADRAAFFKEFSTTGCPLALAGAYWGRYSALSAISLGQLAPAALAEATARAAVNLCLVRRANRDGHVMRSLEIAAVGGFMIAEDTEDHHRLFGPEGECVLYFNSPVEAAEKARWAMAHPAERMVMADACHQRITTGEHTYRDRLRQILAMVPS